METFLQKEWHMAMSGRSPTYLSSLNNPSHTSSRLALSSTKFLEPLARCVKQIVLLTPSNSLAIKTLSFSSVWILFETPP